MNCMLSASVLRPEEDPTVSKQVRDCELDLVEVQSSKFQLRWCRESRNQNSVSEDGHVYAFEPGKEAQ